MENGDDNGIMESLIVNDRVIEVKSSEKNHYEAKESTLYWDSKSCFSQ